MMLTRPERCLGTITQRQLVEDVRDVVLNRPLGDLERLADLPITRSPRQITQDLAFALGQFC